MGKIKLPITDEFLWTLYKTTERMTDLPYIFALHSWNEVWCPDLYEARKNFERRKSRYNFKKFIDYLKHKGYIKIKSLEPKEGVILTQKGMEKILKIALRLNEKKKRKDGKYLMVMFDIPENKRKIREAFRQDLQVLGFFPFQKSVWVSPFDVLAGLQKIIQVYKLEKYTKLFLIEEQNLSQP